jgi:hypothetical protein
MAPEQRVAPHGVVGKAHNPSNLPEQAPAHSALLPAHEARLPCGTPAATGVQVPTNPAISHASHEFVHARSQQTPSGVHVVPSTHPPPVIWQFCPRLLLQAPDASQVPVQRPVGSSVLVAGTQAWLAEHERQVPAQSALVQQALEGMQIESPPTVQDFVPAAHA